MNRLIFPAASLVVGVALGLAIPRRAPQPDSQPAVAASVTAAPAVSERDTERVVTRLQCPDGAVITQTTNRSDSTQAAAPVAASASARSEAPAGPQRDPYAVRVSTDPRSRADAGIDFNARLGASPASMSLGVQRTGGAYSARIGVQFDFGGG